MSNKITTGLFLLIGGLAFTSMSQAGEKNTLSSDEALAASEKSLALDALDNMSGYLRSLDKFSINADVYVDEILENGQKIQQTRSIEVSANPPALLKVKSSNINTTRELYYDGESFTVYMPQPNGFYATFKAPKTIGKLIRKAADDYDIDIPLSDLFLWGSKNDDRSEIEEATVIGVDQVEGISCNHFAFRQKDIDWQLCIQRGDTPLPLKLIITTKLEEAQPQYVAVLKWDIAPVQTKQSYTFIPDVNDEKINFAKSNKNK